MTVPLRIAPTNDLPPDARDDAGAVAIDPLLVDYPQLGNLTATSVRTLKRMVAQGSIPGVIRLGRSVRFDLAAIRGWVAKGCPRPVATRTRRRRPG